MSLIGSVSITNQENGLYLGRVNVENLPDTLISNSFYVNEKIDTMQSKVDESTQADCIYISSGSYNENVQIIDKYNISLLAPTVGNTICEVKGLSISGNSELIRLVSLQIEGISNSIAGVGRHHIYKCVYQGFSTQTNFITIKDCSKYIVFENCEFDQYCNLTVANSFLSVVYFINCNFGGATLNFNQASNQQVILNNCAGFVSLPTNALQVGLNVLATGISNLQTTNINGQAYSQNFMKNLNSGNLSSSLIPFRNDDNDSNNFITDSDFHYNNVDKTLSVQNIEGVQFLSAANISNVSFINNVPYPPPSSSITVSNQADNRVITATAANNSLNAESDLLFDGSILTVGAVKLHPTSSSSATINLTHNNSQTGGNGSVVIGYNAFANSASVSIGNSAQRSNTTGTYNCVIGSFCGDNMTSGNGNCLLGSNNSRNMNSGINNTILGISSGVGITSQNNNTIVGYYSDVKDGAGVSYNNCSVIGANIRGIISGNSQIQLGDSSTTTYVYGTVQTRSDARDKADIQDTQLGLNFIEKLRPRDFKFDYREDYKETINNPETQETTVFHLDKDGSKKRNRYHHGLIAQEVKAVMDDLGIDFGGYQDHKINGGADRLTIGYDELISPMIKAIQQLNEKVKNLELQVRPINT